MEFYERETNLFYIYYQIIKKYKNFMEENLHGYNFTPAEIDVITFLINNQDKNITAKDISEIRGISKGLVSRAVTELRRKNIIKIKENPDDKRSVYLKINNAEENLIEKVREKNKFFIEKIVNDIECEDLALFLKINNKILTNSKSL